ncbi:MAG: LysR family transcriptional regulator, partial [Lachnospiraceae bacterium]|nr:LysR family transcriptional regulator [Lachnospiraceae bacterium]MDY6335148.1 LysR family transcriptional regulator [Lachnospiraceae bacterium]
MELQQLREFCAVADEGTISAAARRLSMTQPPLSLKMKQLEEEIGTPLFLRGARKVE